MCVTIVIQTVSPAKSQRPTAPHVMPLNIGSILHATLLVRLAIFRIMEIAPFVIHFAQNAIPQLLTAQFARHCLPMSHISSTQLVMSTAQSVTLTTTTLV